MAFPPRREGLERETLFHPHLASPVKGEEFKDGRQLWCTR